MSFFGSSSSTKNRLPGKSKAQKALEAQSQQIAKQQTGAYTGLLNQFGQGAPLQQSLFNQFTQQQNALNNLISPQQQAAYEAQQIHNVNQLGGAQNQALQSVLSGLQFGTGATPEQQRLIQQGADQAIQSGLNDLGAFQQRTFDAIRAGSATRGLRPGDTPIVNDFTKTGEEFGRQAQQLIGNIRGQQTEQQLQYPLQAGAFGLNQAQTASGLAGNQRAFENALSQQSLQNRIGQGAQQFSNAAGLAQGNNPNMAPLDALIQQRLGQATSQNYQNPSGFSNLTGVLGAVGGGLQGLQGLGGVAGIAGLFSDEDAKKEIEPLDVSHMLSQLRGYRYKYKDPAHGKGEQVGVMAQDLIRAGLGMAVERDEPTGYLKVNFGKLIPATLASVADLNRRLKQLELNLEAA